MLDNHSQKIRFAVVGAVNTGLDFVLFLALSQLVFPVAANYISTTICIVFSFFASKTFTFRANGGRLRAQMARFLVCNLLGLWVLQPLMISGCLSLFAATGWLPGTGKLVVAKGLATGASLLWNYLTYSRFVFTADKHPKS